MMVDRKTGGDAVKKLFTISTLTCPENIAAIPNASHGRDRSTDACNNISIIIAHLLCLEQEHSRRAFSNYERHYTS